jgi:ethanolamine permease
MAVFGAMFSYVMQGLAFVLLRLRRPNIDRPYRSPLGLAGAVATMAIALVTIYFQLLDPVYRVGVIGVAVWFVIAVAYFALVSRHRLILSPEEEFAMAERLMQRAVVTVRQEMHPRSPCARQAPDTAVARKTADKNDPAV